MVLRELDSGEGAQGNQQKYLGIGEEKSSSISK
jgi:hypothetical protein